MRDAIADNNIAASTIATCVHNRRGGLVAFPSLPAFHRSVRKPKTRCFHMRANPKANGGTFTGPRLPPESFRYNRHAVAIHPLGNPAERCLTTDNRKRHPRQQPLTRSMALPPGLLVTGTNTEVGKTYVASHIVRELVAAGVKVGVYKPAASGCRVENGQLIADDAVALWHAAGRPLTLQAVCPQQFLAPLAPPAAAVAEGRMVDADLLRRGITPWLGYDLVVVEGAGGFLSPLSDRDLVADLAVDLGWPVVIVAANALGVINQTLLTVEACHRRDLQVAAVVLNDVAHHQADASCEGNLAQLRNWLSGSCASIVRMRFAARACDEPVCWKELASPPRR